MIEELVSKLLCRELHPAGLPDAVIGEPSYLDRAEWMRQRLEHENAKYCGCALAFNASTMAHNTGIAELNKAMDLISSDAKAHMYLSAPARDPELVHKESKSADFLRHERFEATAAARRLANYWQIRQLLFEDKTFLPLSDRRRCS
jgi:hypothetical protein